MTRYKVICQMCENGLLKKSTEEPHLGNEHEINKDKINGVGIVCKTMSD